MNIDKNNILNFINKDKIKIKKIKKLISVNNNYNILKKNNSNKFLYYYLNNDISYNFKILQELKLK
jgi:hypothetical protein